MGEEARSRGGQVQGRPGPVGGQVQGRPGPGEARSRGGICVQHVFQVLCKTRSLVGCMQGKKPSRVQARQEP